MLVAGTRPNLNENTGPSIIGDQVQLTLRAPPIAADDPKPARLEILSRQVFSSSTCCQAHGVRGRIRLQILAGTDAGGIA